MNGKKARLQMLSSMITFGTLSLFVRHIGVSSEELALYRAILAAALIGVYLLCTGKMQGFSGVRKNLPLLLLSGVAMGFNWIFLFEAYRYTTVSVATLSYYFAPVLVTLACPILFREKMTARQWICFGMSTLGLILITGLGDLSAGGSHLVGVLFGLSAAALYATVMLLNKFIRGTEGIHRTFLQFLGAIIVLLPYVLLSGGIHPEVLDSTGWICLLIVGLVHTGITYCLYFSALKELPGQKSAILSYIDPLVAIVVSVAVLGERITLWQIAGGILILGFTLWNELGTQKEE